MAPLNMHRFGISLNRRLRFRISRIGFFIFMQLNASCDVTTAADQGGISEDEEGSRVGVWKNRSDAFVGPTFAEREFT